MAEYIEKTSVIQARPESLYEDVESENGDEKDTLRKQSFNKGWNSCKKTYLEDIEQIPIADVIEHSKVDKAIEEINDMAYIGFCTEALGNKVLVFKDDVLDILKEIYESKTMPEYGEYISALRQCAKEHEKDMTPTFQIRVSDLCNDTAKLLENDVIQRAKVNKAIQDIEFEKRYLRHENIELDKMFDKGLDKALEILKRDIGG